MDDFIPYGRQSIDEDDVQAVIRALRSDWLTTGPAVEGFEAALSSVAGRQPVVAVNSGTAALHAAYAAAGAGPGTNIVTTPLTFAATATAALHLGAEVRFADVDPGTLLIDPARVAELVDDDTVVIAPVDFAGQPADVDALRPIATRVGATIVQDAAHSLGAFDRGRPVGDIADMTTFSFHPVKTITTGEGGAVVVREERFLEPVRSFRSHGIVRDRDRLQAPDEGPWHQEVQSLGLNYRMPDVLAALGRSQLTKLEGFVRRRSELVDRYREAFAGSAGLGLVEQRPGTEPAWHLFPIRVPEGWRRSLYDHLRSEGIGTQVHYLPVPRHPLFAGRNVIGDTRHASAAYSELLSLPLHPTMSDATQDRVIDATLQWLAGAP